MKISFLRLSVIAVILLFLGGCSSPTNKEMAPEIVEELVDGSSFKLSDLKGKYVLLHFWGSWCGPCLRENPEMVKLYNEFGNDVAFVSIALEKDDRNWKKVVEKFGMNWKYQIVQKSKMIMVNEHALAYAVSDIPATFLIAPDGTLVSKFHIGQIREVLNAMMDES